MSAPDAVRAFLSERGLADEVVTGGAEGLVVRWEQAAREAERERYPFGVEDWLNELDGRQLLHDLQAVQQLIRDADLEVAVQFVNYR